MTDRRSEAARQYRNLYKTKAWQDLRVAALVRDCYTCQECGVILTNGRSSPRAAEIHHVQPHKGDRKLFFALDNVTSVCKHCHSTRLQSQERLGYSTEAGLDGWPVDPRHPANTGQLPKRWGHGIARSRDRHREATRGGGCKSSKH